MCLVNVCVIIIIVITSAKEVMLSLALVCLLARLHKKITRLIFPNLVKGGTWDAEETV